MHPSNVIDGSTGMPKSLSRQARAYAITSALGKLIVTDFVGSWPSAPVTDLER
jgi:hypothetical protein